MSGIRSGRLRIGITADVIPRGHRRRYSIYNTYAEAVRLVDGLPLGIFPSSPETIPQILECVDGLILPGGDDLHPRHWGEEEVHPSVILSQEERTIFELTLIHAAVERGIPILGICLGFQTINVAFGGSVLQHIDPELGHGSGEGGLAEDNEHDILIVPETLLAELLKTDRVRVNSGHHQALGSIGDGLQISARSEDGIVEAIESQDGSFLLGVQWHPEERLDNAVTLSLLRGLLAAAV